MLTWSENEKGQEGGREDDLRPTSIEVLCKCRQEKTKIVPKTKAMVDLKMFWVSNRVLGIKSRPFYTTCSCSGITCIPCIHRLIDFTQSYYKSINTYPNPSWRKEIMNEDATTVQANHPPSGFSESQECCRPNVTVRVSGFSLWSRSSSSNVTFCWSCWLVISVVKGHTTNSQLSIQGDFST